MLYISFRLNREQAHFYNRENASLQNAGWIKQTNTALDEYIEILNRDTKDIVPSNQTKKSIISHS